MALDPGALRRILPAVLTTGTCTGLQWFPTRSSARPAETRRPTMAASHSDMQGQELRHLPAEHRDWIFSVEAFGWGDAAVMLLGAALVVVAGRRWRRRRG